MIRLYSLAFLILTLCLPLQSFAEPVKIGIMLPLSGPFAAIGADGQQGIEIAKSEIDPSVQIEFILGDSKADPNTAVAEFNKMVSVDKVNAVYAFRGPIGMALNPLSKSAHIPLLGGVGNKQFALSNDYAFQLWPRADVEGELLAEKFFKDGSKRPALITVQDDYPIAVSVGFREKLKGLGVALSSDTEILPSDTDFRIPISKLRSLNVDAVFVNLGINQIGPFVRQMHELGLRLPLFSNFWAGKKDVIEAGGEAMNGLVFVEMSTEYPHLKQELETRFKSNPSGATVSAYVGTIMIAQAVKKIEGSKSSDLYSALRGLSGIQTESGLFKVQDRFVQFPLTLRIVKNNVASDLK